uniref:Uncharacterized protein LOC109506525 n=1 Tax=Elaeis guineensis var. tenera TaxID=51953 RepID=A0A6J0PQH7_ELAGV|nr:uncharacterized protein LOC109506525 [Elaeis guineensis]
MDEPFLPRFKMLQMESYDGTTDSMNHLENFQTLVLLQRASDATLYRDFPSTLRKVARHWIMPFGLKNVEATYQCLINKIFKEQIGQNMEVYVNDILVKSWVAEHHITDLEESFTALR